MTRYVFYSDGGSRGNPGPSAYAVVCTRDGEVFHERSEYLGIHTNNYAEYRGLIANLVKAIEVGADSLEIVMDSQLVIRQMTGEYAVKNPDMKALYDDAKNLVSMIPKVSFRNVRRSEEMIPRADFLLNEEMDRHRSLDFRYEFRDLHHLLVAGGHVPERDRVLLEFFGTDDDGVSRPDGGGVFHGLRHLAPHDVHVGGDPVGTQKCQYLR